MVREVVYQEGEVAADEAAGILPRPDNVTVLPVWLARPAIQTFDSYQNHESIVFHQASIQFQGLQGLINNPSPAPPNNSPADGYNFYLQLSNVSYDNYQDHTQQTASSDSP